MTREDCLRALEKCTDRSYLTGPWGAGYLPLESNFSESGTGLDRILTATSVDELECEVIRAYRPCLNSACNLEPTPLPDHYQVPWDKVSDPRGRAAAEALLPKKDSPRQRRKSRSE
jgi:hypothetical protein